MPEYTVSKKGMGHNGLSFKLIADNWSYAAQILTEINPQILITNYNFYPIPYSAHYVAIGLGSYEDMMKLPQTIRDAPAHFNPIYFEIEKVE